MSRNCLSPSSYVLGSRCHACKDAGKISPDLQAASAFLLAEWTVVQPLSHGRDGEAAVGSAYKGTGTMFRYSGQWGRIPDESLSQRLVAEGKAAIPDVAAALQRHVHVASIWAAFRSFVMEKVQRAGLQRWTIALEMHVEASLATSMPCVHLHWMFDSLTKGVALSSKDGLRFQGSLPYRSLEAPQARGRSCKRAFDQGHFYLQAGKIGGVLLETNSPAFKAFPVTPEWITNLWQTQKISSDVAKQLYISAKKHIKQYTENVRTFTQMSQQLQVQSAKRDAQLALQAMRRPSVRLEVVEEQFRPQFAHHDFRRKFLVLDGPTRVGKTQYAKSLAGEPCTLEVNCANCIEPDLRDFNPAIHKAIVFDEASASLVLRHKKLFQGGVEEVTMSSSATNMYSYTVWVYGCMLIVTSNHWERDLAELSEEDANWLRGNSIVVFCAQQLYA